MIVHLSEKHHFVSVFDIDDKKFLVDDLSTELIVLDKGLRKHFSVISNKCFVSFILLRLEFKNKNR